MFGSESSKLRNSEKQTKKDFGFLIVLNVATLGLHSCISTCGEAKKGLLTITGHWLSSSPKSTPFLLLDLIICLSSLNSRICLNLERGVSKKKKKINLIKPITDLLFLLIIH